MVEFFHISLFLTAYALIGTITYGACRINPSLNDDEDGWWIFLFFVMWPLGIAVLIICVIVALLQVLFRMISGIKPR